METTTQTPSKEKNDVTFQQVNKAQQTYIELRDSLTEDSVHQAFIPVFEKFPELLALSWVQYIPSFNDGDPCTFSAGELNRITTSEIDELVEEELFDKIDAAVLMNPEERDDEELQEVFHCEMGHNEYSAFCSPNHYGDNVTELEKEVGKVWNLIGEDSLEAIFSSYAHVVITKAKISVRDYEPRY